MVHTFLDSWPLVLCFPLAFDMMMALRSTENRNITPKNLSQLGPNSAIPRVPIILRDFRITIVTV